MDIKQIYREETGLDVYRDNDAWNWEFSPEYVKWLEKQLTIPVVVGQSEQLKPKEQICYKSNEPCEYDCPGLCKESC